MVFVCKNLLWGANSCSLRCLGHGIGANTVCIFELLYVKMRKGSHFYV